MLGVRRTTVTVAAQSLQQAGFIRYHRGHMSILKADLLKDASYECYDAIKARFARLFGPRSNW